MKLWFDDVRPAPVGWVWARTLAEATQLLEENHVTECSLDHDLGHHNVEIPDDPDELLDVIYLKGQSEETGYDLVVWMIENERVPQSITIHSWNPDGAQRMAQRFADHGYDCAVVPFQVRT